MEICNPGPARDSCPPARTAIRRTLGASWIACLVLCALVAGSGPPPMRPPDAQSAVSGPPQLPDHACRFWGMIGTAAADSIVDDQLLSGTYSLEKLAESNPNGWSISYFSPTLAGIGLSRPEVLRGGPPANHEYDRRYADAVSEMLALDPTCAVAHVRAASSGHAHVPDPHPFVRGETILVHNGTISRDVLEALLLEDDPKYLETHPPDYTDPNIDSELYFLYLMKLREQGVDRGDGVRRFSTADVIRTALLRIYAADGIQTAGNCLLTSGDSLFAVRFDRSDSERYKVRYTKIPEAHIVASEPVGSDTTGWLELPPKSLGVFTPGAVPELVTIFPPPGPWITVAASKIDDDLYGQSAGNDDGDVDAGETIELQVMLGNEGTDPATFVTAELALKDSLLTFIDSLTSYPDIPPGDSIPPLSPFVFSVAAEPQFYHLLEFVLTVTTGTGPDLQTWEHNLPLPVWSPVLNYQGHLVSDGNDGLLQPDEQGELQVWLRNIGTENATGLVGTLSTEYPYVDILQNQGVHDTLMVGEVDSLAPPYELYVHADCPVPETVTFDVSVVSDWGLSFEIPLDVPVGGYAENFEGGTGEWTHEAGMPPFGDAWHLSDLRNHTPTGVWAWKCGAPDSGVVYDDRLDAILISPVVDLVEHTELRFWHWIFAELGHQFGTANDGGLVEASINGGPWQQLYPETGYDFVIGVSDVPGPFPLQTPVYAGYFTWREEVFVINGYTGTIQFRFRFGSDGEFGMEGWYIDDVLVIGRQLFSDAPETRELPLRPALSVGGPNPFRDATRILYDVARPGDVELAILDLEGRVVRHLVRGSRPVGRHAVTWDGRDGRGREVSSGLYFYRLRSEADRFEEVRRVIRLR